MRALAALSFMVVDDSRPMCALARSVLRGYGVRAAYEANDVENAWMLFLLRRPDIVLVDFDMPGSDGLALIERIRRDPTSPAADAAIILMTGFSERNRVLTARDAGASEVIAKPISAKSLLGRISAVVDQPRCFVRSANFVGPDRRRRAKAGYLGPFRRAVDDEVVEVDAPCASVLRQA